MSLHPFPPSHCPTRSLEAIAYHGWGFDHTCWHLWKDWFAEEGWGFQAFDHGYFNTPAHPAFSDSDNRNEGRPVRSKKVILAHSYGLHLCPIKQLQMADILVIFSSFIHFHPTDERLKRRSQVMVQQMIDQCTQKPLMVLENFHSKCYHPLSWEKRSFEFLNTSLLLQDLKELNQRSIDPTILKSLPKIMVLHGSGDRIVSEKKGQEFKNLGLNNCHYQEFLDLPHALPFSHFEACRSYLKPFFQALQNIFGKEDI